MTKEERRKQEKEILEKAKECGLEVNYFFATTFDRYVKLLDRLDALDDTIEEVGEMTTKEYVRGRENIVVNPALNASNNTISHANKTAETCMSIISKFKGMKESNNVDPLIDILNGGQNDESV